MYSRSMDLELTGKSAFIGGGSSGLGLSCALALAAEGVSVTVVSRDLDKLEEARGVIVSAHPEATVNTVSADLSSIEGARGALAEATSKTGGFDILVLNSGGPKPGDVEAISIEDLRTALEANFLSMVELVQGTTSYMKDVGWGRIVAITSLYVKEPNEHMVLSNSARSALTAYLKSASHTYKDHGITINTVQPGLHLTDRLLALRNGRLPAEGEHVGDPGDFGKTVAFLCSAQAKFINGVSLVVDGGTSRGLQ